MSVGEHPQPNGERKAKLQLVDALFAVCRSITGEGLRASLHSVAVLSGTKVLDWRVP